MLENYVHIMLLLKDATEIRTRKKLQKIVYLLQRKGAPFDENFSLHHYGPYSPELQIEVDQLDEADLIDQEFKADSYFFRLTGKGETFIEKEISHVIGVHELKDLIRNLNALEPHILEMMATIVYFEKSYGNDKVKLKSVLGSIKPHLMPNFDKAWELLDKHDLHAEEKS